MPGETGQEPDWRPQAILDNQALIMQALSILVARVLGANALSTRLNDRVDQLEQWRREEIGRRIVKEGGGATGA